MIYELTAGVLLGILEGVELAIELFLLLLVPAGKVLEGDRALVRVDNERVGALHGLEVGTDGVKIFFCRVYYREHKVHNKTIEKRRKLFAQKFR